MLGHHIYALNILVAGAADLTLWAELVWRTRKTFDGTSEIAHLPWLVKDEWWFAWTKFCTTIPVTEKVRFTSTHIPNKESWLSSRTHILGCIIWSLSTGNSSQEANRDENCNYYKGWLDVRSWFDCILGNILKLTHCRKRKTAGGTDPCWWNAKKWYFAKLESSLYINPRLAIRLIPHVAVLWNPWHRLISQSHFTDERHSNLNVYTQIHLTVNSFIPHFTIWSSKFLLRTRVIFN